MNNIFIALVIAVFVVGAFSISAIAYNADGDAALFDSTGNFLEDGSFVAFDTTSYNDDFVTGEVTFAEEFSEKGLLETVEIEELFLSFLSPEKRATVEELTARFQGDPDAAGEYFVQLLAERAQQIETDGIEMGMF